MATRCTISIEGMKPIIYKHWDGYPSVMLQWLDAFNKEFTEARGNDKEYKFAQLLRASAFDAEKYDLDDSRTTGWGVYEKFKDIDQTFNYLLKADGSVVMTEYNINPQLKKNAKRIIK
jgi:hypothetical protein